MRDVGIQLCDWLQLPCESDDDISNEHKCAVVDIVQAIESLPVFSLIRAVISDTDDAVKSSTDQRCKNVSLRFLIFLSRFTFSNVYFLNVF